MRLPFYGVHFEDIHRIDFQIGIALGTLIVHRARKRVVSKVFETVLPRIFDGYFLRIERTLVSAFHAYYLICQHSTHLSEQP